MGGRTLIYQILGALYKSLAIQPSIGEVGVLSGSNARDMFDIIKPISMILVDAWSASATIYTGHESAHRYWVDHPSVHEGYYGGSLEDQTTYDRLLEVAQDRFANAEGVQFLRMTSINAHSFLKKSNKTFDLIYVDANHGYEQAFDDIFLYSELLNKQGFIQLNDCCHSPDGIRQNLGVLPAAVKFCKMRDFIPIMVTNTDWTDVLFAHRESDYIPFIDIIIRENNIRYVEVPCQLLGALEVKYGRWTQNLSFK